MVICGNFALSHDECRAQFAIWAVLAAPLYLSLDLRSVSEDTRSVLLNKEVVQVNQDSAGVQGRVTLHTCTHHTMYIRNIHALWLLFVTVCILHA